MNFNPKQWFRIHTWLLLSWWSFNLHLGMAHIYSQTAISKSVPEPMQWLPAQGPKITDMILDLVTCTQRFLQILSFDDLPCRWCDVKSLHNFTMWNIILKLFHNLMMDFFYRPLPIFAFEKLWRKTIFTPNPITDLLPIANHFSKCRLHIRPCEKSSCVQMKEKNIDAYLWAVVFKTHRT